MEAPSGYNKAEARSYFYENFFKHDVQSLSEKVFHKLIKGLQSICSEREAIDFDFTRSKIITSGMSSLKGVARLQTSAARHFLVKGVASFAKKCHRGSEREGELIHQYLVNKLLKNTNCKTTEEFLKQDNCVINGSHFLRLLNLVRNGSYIGLRAKQRRNKKRATEEVAAVNKRGCCFPVKVTYMPSRVTCEFFDQVVINGKPFAFFAPIMKREN